MIKKFYCLIVFVLMLFGKICAQNIPDALWPIGDKNEYPIGIDSFGTEFFGFQNGVFQPYFKKKFVSFICSVSAITKDQKLVYFSNGINIYNEKLDIMENGNDINPGQLQIDFNKSGYPVVNGIFGVFSPGNENKEVDIIHMQAEYATGKYTKCDGSFLYQTKIDIQANNGLGRVLFKNKIIGTGPFKEGGIAACRHANGRDWWFAVNSCNDSSLHVYLLSPEGAKLHHKDNMIRNFFGSPAQAVFSPDGKYFALHNNTETESEIHLFDFDRCTGHFSNHRLWTYIDLTSVNPPFQPTAGVAISPNSRFIYIISREKIHQYDLWAADVPSSDKVVAIFDGFEDIFSQTVFFIAQLAPDGKIYITGRGSLFYLTVIDKPDLLGIQCDVKQHSIPLFFQNDFSMPYFPYFKLGVEKGSVCDSLVVNQKEYSTDNTFNFYPSPITNYFYIEGGSWQIKNAILVDLQGVIVKKYSGNCLNKFDVTDISPGVYFLKCNDKYHALIKKLIIK